MVENQTKLHVIHKIQLQMVDGQTVLLPKGAKILRVDFQFSKPVLWFLLDKSVIEREPRCITIWGTGEIIVGEPGRYINTMFLQAAGEVYHVFETTGGE